MPHHGNNHKAHLIKSYSLFLLTFVFVFLQIFLNFFIIARPSVLGFSSNITPEKVIELTNLERANLGLDGLEENKLLSEAARQKAAEMFALNYWAHISPSGRTPWAFFADVGYKYQYAGENLARDFQDTDSVLRAWMNSSSHRENIVNPKYQEIGVAVVQGTLQGVETSLVVQLFGTPYGALQKHPAPVEQKAEIPARSLEIVSKEVLSRQTGKELPITSPLDLTKSIVILVAGILIGVFAVDLFLASHHQSPRLSSRSMAQMMFLIFILIASMLIKEGAIL